MNKPNLTAVVRTVQTTLSQHRPAIMMGVGITGMLTTVVLAVKATPKAMELIDSEKHDRFYVDHDDTPLTKMEMVKVAWKPYIPAILTATVSTACLVGSHTESTRRATALATAYKLSETALNEYKDAVIETVGEKKERIIRDKVAEKAIQRENIDEEDVIITGRGNTRCYDAVFGRCFRSSREVIERGINAVNRQIVSGDMYASLNDFYDAIGLDHVDIGDLLGWTLNDGEIQIDFSSQLAANGEPTLVIHYNVVPKYDYYKFL